MQQALRDRLVCGLNRSAIQKRLLAESELTLKRALEIAQSIEAAAKQAEYLNLSKLTASADHKQKFQRSSPLGKNQQPCFRCGRQDHNRHLWKFKNQT